MNKRILGTNMETLAAEFLKKSGVRIIMRNYRCPFGEIDLILKEQNTLVFAEVKYRSNTRLGSPEESVNPRKQLKIIQASKFYIMKYHVSSFTAIRYDVIAIDQHEIRWLRGAFGSM